MAATANLYACCLTSFPGHWRNSLATSASSNFYFRCQVAGITNQNFRMLKWMSVTVTVQCMTQLLGFTVVMWFHTGIGALHNDRFSKDLYFTSVIEPTASSCFHEQESPILQLPWCYIHIQLDSRNFPGRFSYGLGTRLVLLCFLSVVQSHQCLWKPRTPEREWALCFHFQPCLNPTL